MERGSALKSGTRTRAVLAISSGGGHWLQLSRLCDAWRGTALVTACTADSPAMDTPACRHYRLRDATRWNRWDLLVLGVQVGRVIWRERPAVVITTGAAPGLWAMVWGRAIGARTVWIDSLANVQRISAAGRLARWVAHDWWTQWPHLAAQDQPSLGRRRPGYHGAVW
ncbi:MAG: hypothetical protein RIR43_420 [Pseudomonadota bacterium]|jgi:hypothetical protein